MRLKKNIYIHIGTEKTGTKTIQKFCIQNHDFLLSNNIFYPNNIDEPHVFKRTHWSLAACVADNNEFVPENKRFSPEVAFGSLKKEIDKNPCDNILISAEPFSTNVVNVNSIKTIKKCLKDYNVKIIIYLRRQDDYFISSVSTYVKGGRYIKENDFGASKVLAQKNRYDYLHILERWSQVFGKENMIVKRFEKQSMKNENLMEDFFDIFGITDFEFDKKYKRNTSLSLESLYFMNSINKKYQLESKARNQLYIALEKLAPVHSIKDLISPDKRIEILNYYRESNNKLAKEYFNDEQLFIENVDDSTQWSRYLGPTLEELTRIVKGIQHKIKIPVFNSMLIKQTAVKGIKNNPSFSNMIDEKNEKKSLPARIKKYLKKCRSYIKNEFFADSSPIDKVFIHVGMHKTGTTSIQGTLFKNNGILHKNNILYSKQWGRNHSVPVRNIWDDNPEAYHINIKMGLSKRKIKKVNKSYKKRFCNEIRNTKLNTLVLSGEGICKMDKKNLMEFKSFLLSVLPNAKIEILICLREPVAYIASAYLQAVKGGGGKSIDAQIKICKSLYRKRIDKFVELFGKDKVTIYKFEDALKHQYGLVACFLELIGVKKNDLDAFEYTRANAAISNKAEEIISYINSRQTLIENNKIAEDREMGDIRLLRKIRGEKFCLDRKTVEKIIKQNKNDIEWLKKNIGIDYTIDINKYELKNIKKYNDEFFEDIKSAFPELSKFIQKLVYDYMKTTSDTLKDKQTKEAFSEIMTWMKTQTNIL